MAWNIQKMKQTKYDIFISYRRTAYDTANLIAEKLRNAGYKVFFDVDTLTGGKFNEQLLDVIQNCKDVIVVLSEDALERCNQPDDWVRKEVVFAMEHHKNIIPVMLDGFSWPNPMPYGMEELENYQAITATRHEYFDMAVQRLQGYLRSKPSKPIKKWLAKAGIALGVLFVALLIGVGIVNHIADVTCNDIGTTQSAGMSTMALLNDDCKLLKDEWAAFYKAIEKSQKEEDRHDAEVVLSKSIDKIEKSVKVLHKSFPAPKFSFNSFENYVLAYYKIEKEDINAFSKYYDTMFDDVYNIIASSREMIGNHTYSQIERDNLLAGFNYFSHSLNAFYYGYLGSLSLLPKSARKNHFEMAKKWGCYPNGTPLDLTQEEYVQFQMQEMAKCEEELNHLNAVVNYEDRMLDDLEGRIDELERKGN